MLCDGSGGSGGTGGSGMQMSTIHLFILLSRYNFTLKLIKLTYKAALVVAGVRYRCVYNVFHICLLIHI